MLNSVLAVDSVLQTQNLKNTNVSEYRNSSGKKYFCWTIFRKRRNILFIKYNPIIQDLT